MSNNTLANPAPLGLLGFGMTTILLNLHNAEICKLNAVVMAMGIFMGGMQQIIAGVMEWKKGNIFGMTAFTSYGFFWLSLVGIWIFPEMNLGEGAAAKADELSKGFYLLIWGIFTLFMFVGTLNGATIGKLIFGSLTILFFLLATANFTGSETIHRIAGFEGILCGSFAFYEAVALVLNEKLGKKVLPLG